MNDENLKIQDDVRKILIPILDVFGGADGGVSFAQLQHQIMRDIYQKPKEDLTDFDKKIMTVVEDFSRLCSNLLRMKY